MLKFSALLNISVYGVALLLGSFGAVLGLLRGACRQTVRFVTVVASAVLSFLACLGIYPLINGILDDMSMNQFVNMVASGAEEPIKKILGCFDSSLIGDIVALPLALVVMPVIFVLLFVLISLLMLILHKVLCGALAFTQKRNNVLTRIGGAALGFVQGLIVAAILLVPVSGTLDTLEHSVVKACEAHPGAHNAVELNKSFVNNFGSTVNNPVMRISEGISKVTFNGWSKIKVDGDEIDVRDTVDTAVDIVVVLGDLAKCDFSEFNEDEKVAFRALTKDIYGNRYLATVFSGFLRGFAKTIDEGAIIVTFEDPVGGFVEKFIDVFSTSNKENLDDDFITVENIIFIMGDDGAIETMQKSPEDMFEKFTVIGDDGHTLFGRMALEFEKNPRTIALSHELSSLSMSLLLAGKGQDMEKTEAAMNDVSNTIDTVINLDKDSFATEEEYKAEVNKTVDTTLKDNGIELEPAQVEELSDYILTEFEGRESVTEAEISDFMIKYYELHAKEQGTKSVQ